MSYGKLMSDGKLDTIVILDAIPAGELNSARRLLDDLNDIANYKVEGLGVKYIRIDTISDLEQAIGDLNSQCLKDGVLPSLHLEGHGSPDENGFVTATGEFCSWARLKDTITPLNIATGLNLLVIFATCFGGSFARAIRVTDRAPLWGLIGPDQEITAGEALDGFKAFYTAFFDTGSIQAAIASLNESARGISYYRNTAETFFYQVWASYKMQECSKIEVSKRAKLIYKDLKSKGVENRPSVGSIKRKILNKRQEQAFFEESRDKYFMFDLSPANRLRFLVTYHEAERLALRLVNQ